MGTITSDDSDKNKKKKIEDEDEIPIDFVVSKAASVPTKSDVKMVTCPICKKTMPYWIFISLDHECLK